MTWFACTSVFPTECERSEGRKDGFLFNNILDSFYSSPSPLTTRSEPCHRPAGFLQLSFEGPSCEHGCHAPGILHGECSWERGNQIMISSA